MPSSFCQTLGCVLIEETCVFRHRRQRSNALCIVKSGQRFQSLRFVRSRFNDSRLDRLYARPCLRYVVAIFWKKVNLFGQLDLRKLGLIQFVG